MLLVTSAQHHVMSVSLCNEMTEKISLEEIWPRKSIGKVTGRKTIQSRFPLGYLEFCEKTLFERR